MRLSVTVVLLVKICRIYHKVYLTRFSHVKNAQCYEHLSLPGVHGYVASVWCVLVLEHSSRPWGVSGYKNLEILLHCSTYRQKRPQVR